MVIWQILCSLNHFKNEYERVARTVFRSLNVNGTTLRMLNIDGFCIDTKKDVVQELFKISKYQRK